MGDKSIDTRALYMISSGVYLVSTGYEGILNGQIVNTAMQVSGKPEICIATALHKENYTTELLKKSRRFSISILDENVPMTFIGTFGFRCGRDHDKFEKCNFKVHDNCLPVVTDYTLASLCADVVAVQEVKTHFLFIGRVHYAEVLKEGVPLTYKAYHEIKKGKSPKHAPSHLFNDGNNNNS